MPPAQDVEERVRSEYKGASSGHSDCEGSLMNEAQRKLNGTAGDMQRHMDAWPLAARMIPYRTGGYR